MKKFFLDSVSKQGHQMSVYNCYYTALYLDIRLLKTSG